MKQALIKALPAGAAAIAVAAFMFAPVASAAQLTDQQKQAIISLVASFGADATTIANVTASLNGTAPSTGSTGSGSVINMFRPGSLPPCLTLRNTLTPGTTDSSTGGEVSSVQKVLIAQGFLPLAAPTGFYGSMTAQAVAKFQAQNGVSAVGTVGPATRAVFAGACRSVLSPITGGNPTLPSPSVSTSDSMFIGVDAQLQGLDADLSTADDASAQNDDDQ